MGNGGTTVTLRRGYGYDWAVGAATPTHQKQRITKPTWLALVSRSSPTRTFLARMFVRRQESSVLRPFFLQPPSSLAAAQPTGAYPGCRSLRLASLGFKHKLRIKGMSEAIVFQKFPMVQKVEPGTYWWCACGRSKAQPFCDGSHKGTGLGPIKTEITEAKTVAWCGCKHSQHAPFCDGSHAKL